MMEFVYDRSKALENLRKHGVSFEEAVTSFYDRNATTDPDEEHSTTEDERFVTMGYSARGRLLFVVHNEEEGMIRVISARVASPTQRAHYEEA